MPPPAELRDRLRRLLPLAAVILPVAAIAIAATQLAHVPAVRQAVDAVRASGGAWWAVPLYFVLYALFAVFLLPVGLLSVASAVAWGWKTGGTIELVTSTLVAIVPYILAQRGLRRVASASLPVIDSPFTLFLLRIVPLVPYVALNYIAGATKLRIREFVAMTFVGSIPSVYLFAYFIDTMAAGAIGAATQAKIIGACAVVALAVVALRFGGQWVRRRFS